MPDEPGAADHCNHALCPPSCYLRRVADRRMDGSDGWINRILALNFGTGHCDLSDDAILCPRYAHAIRANADKCDDVHGLQSASLCRPPIRLAYKNKSKRLCCCGMYIAWLGFAGAICCLGGLVLSDPPRACISGCAHRYIAHSRPIPS